MAATRDDVNMWIEIAKGGNYEFIISVCDTFDWDDYPVFCKNKEEVLKESRQYNGVNMQKINEIIQIKSDGSVREDLNLAMI
ncbi:MAG TPA: hypothetical protein VMZ91_04490 [Candidatus Paceibacterota bacterium]|nr:hypothetical protein [Candidatus Paceibacterota bacterium]